MGRRYISLWLPEWPIQRMRLKARRTGRPLPPADAPLALVAMDRGVPRLTAVNPAGRALSLTRVWHWRMHGRSALCCFSATPSPPLMPTSWKRWACGAAATAHG